MKQHYPRTGLLLWKQKLLIIPFFLSVLFATKTYGQAYVNYSRQFTSAGADVATGLATDDAGNGYMLASFAAVPVSFAPTIAGTPNATGNKQILFKFSANGGIVWSRYMTTSTGQPLALSKVVYENGKLFGIASTSITNLPTTDGSTYHGGTSDIIYQVLDANTGATQTLSYQGGSGQDQSGLDIVAENGFAYLLYVTNSPDIPVTTGPAFNVQYDLAITKLTASGATVYSTYAGNVSASAAVASNNMLAVQNGIVAMATNVTAVNNFQVTTGNGYVGGNDWGVVKLNADGSTSFRTIIGGSLNEGSPSVVVNNGEVFVGGLTLSTNFPTTDGSASTGGVRWHTITKLNNAGAVVFSKIVAGLHHTTDAVVSPIKFNSGSVWLHGSDFSGQATVNETDGSTGGVYIIRMNPANGQYVYATCFGGIRSLAANGLGFDVLEGRAISMTSTLNIVTHVTTDGTTRLTNGGNYLAVYSPEGKLTYGTYRLTGQGTSVAQTFLSASNNRIYTAGVNQNTGTNHIPVTEPILGTPNNAEVQMVSFALCPALPTQNDLAPLSQTICGGGFTQAITGNKVSVPSSAMPTLTRLAVNITQPEINARYQWQTSTSASGPWTNIAGAAGNLKDYSPPSLAETRYYRRLALPPAG
ncbi:MAG: hypothetical protein ACTHMC_01965, partial [Pseudobacter sp.]|uniref:hypothetical protein n=1 Tax=Pseudobacter sp. TaxID=2045420 RepID=UPI003F82064D